MPNADPRIAELVTAGEIRLGLFLPQYKKDASGALHGLGTGFIAIELVNTLAARLGLKARVIEHPTPSQAVESLKTNASDVAFLGIEPSRVAVVDFTPPLFQFDYSLLVPAGSTIKNLAEANQAECRIGLVDGHASALALRRLIKQAELVGVELPEDAFDLLKDGKVDTLAFPRDQLIEFADRLPGARVLKDGYGVNRVAMALHKGRSDLLSYLSEFAEEARAAGLVQAAIDRGGLRGFDAATA